MSNEPIIDFQCSKCGKRLKAASKYASKRVKCPKCQQPVTVPAASQSASAPAGPSTPSPHQPTANPPVSEPAPPKPVASLDDGWLNLGGPAIADATQRQHEFEEKKAAMERERVSRLNKQRQRRAPADLAAEAQKVHPKSAAPVSAGLDDDDFSLAPLSPPTNARSSGQTTSDAETSSDAPPPKRSVFEDDLPELAELEPRATAASKESKLLARHAGVDAQELDGLDALAPSRIPSPTSTSRQSPRTSPNAGGGNSLPSLFDEGTAAEGSAQQRAKQRTEKEETVEQDPQYRVSCPACGTAQYVRLSSKGKKLKCPDCYLEFRIPPPPPNWAPKKQKLKLSDEDMPLAAFEDTQQAQAAEGQRSRASQILEKAKQQVSEEDLDRLYDGDFDTAGFVQSTFGFLKDPIALAHIFAFAVVSALIFALGQLAANNHESSFGRGVLLLATLGAPVAGLLFTMPMLSSALALLESVANRQPRVTDWPGFNIFENAGDMIATTLAMLAAIVPGYLVGTWLAGDTIGAGRIQIAGMMVSSFLLFPVFLLSMLDNGSVFAPLSGSVLRSLTEAVESWGAYFLKTFIAFSFVMLMWLLLLGKNEILAAIAGSLFPPLVFFTFQQLGALADGISEHLSFEFTPPGNEDDDADADSPDAVAVVPKAEADRKRPAPKSV